MGIKVDPNRLIASLKASEKAGPLDSQDELWREIARRYNSGDGLPKKFSGQEFQPITKSIVYQKLVRRMKIQPKTPKKKSGRPPGSSPIQEVLGFLTQEAVEKKWKAEDSKAWESLNSLRRAAGLIEVEPTNNPDENHFVNKFA